MTYFSKFAAVALGGALGALARYALNLMMAGIFPNFPISTFFINISGSFLIGLILSLSADKFPLSETWRLFLSVGCLGAFTTFSTFEYETYQMMQEKRIFAAFFYVSLSFALGLAALMAGAAIARKISL